MRASLVILVAFAIVSNVKTQGPDEWFPENDDERNINPRHCGRRLVAFPDGKISSPRVVGGVEAIPEDFNWQVTLARQAPGSPAAPSFFCSGSIINSRWVVSAAHCTVGQTMANLLLELGMHNRLQPESWVITRRVTRVINHPSYSSSTYANDISLLKMVDPIEKYTKQIAPVCLPSSTKLYADGTWFAVASGWGTTTPGGSVQTTLREVEVPILTDARCRAAPASPDTTTMICAADVGDGVDTCQGDSGGPLVVEDVHPGSVSEKNSLLVGITSWGVGCGDIGVYTRVQTYISWIQSTIRANNSTLTY